MLVLQHSLDNLLFLNQEGSDNSLLDTVGTSRTAVSSLHGLVGLGNLSVLSWSQRRDTWQLAATVTTLDLRSLLLDVLGNQLSTWGLDDLDLVGSGVVWFVSIYSSGDDKKIEADNIDKRDKRTFGKLEKMCSE